MSIETKREAHSDALTNLIEAAKRGHDGDADWNAEIETFDACGDARELKGHVEVCAKHQLIDGYATGEACGSGWLCDQAPRGK